VLRRRVPRAAGELGRGEPTAGRRVAGPAPGTGGQDPTPATSNSSRDAGHAEPGTPPSPAPRRARHPADPGAPDDDRTPSARTSADPPRAPAPARDRVGRGHDRRLLDPDPPGGVGADRRRRGPAGGDDLRAVHLVRRRRRPEPAGHCTPRCGPTSPDGRSRSRELASPSGDARTGASLSAFLHVTDYQFPDVQSPARAEFLSRYADEPFVSLGDATGYGQEALILGSTWRPQEALVVHACEALHRQVQDLRVGPVTGRSLDFAISTGTTSTTSRPTSCAGS
jgi:hypothetical protein